MRLVSCACVQCQGMLGSVRMPSIVACGRWGVTPPAIYLLLPLPVYSLWLYGTLGMESRRQDGSSILGCEWHL